MFLLLLCTLHTLPITLLILIYMQALPGYTEPEEPLSKSALELLNLTESVPKPRDGGPSEQLMSDKQLHLASL